MTRRREVVREGLREHVTSGLHLGQLRPGDRLESARQIAREAGTDYRMVVAALRELERDGLLEIRPRGGIYVGHRAAPPRSSRLPGFGDRLVDLVLDELAIGLPVAVVTERLRHCLDTRGLRAACVECNDDQLDFLCQELQIGFGLDSVRVEIHRLRGEPPLVVRQADLLVSTTFHARDVRRVAARLNKPCVIVTLDPQRREDVTRLLAERPVCFVGTDWRWAAKERAIWARQPGAERLQALTLGHDPLESIPEECGADGDAAGTTVAGRQLALGAGPAATRLLPRNGTADPLVPGAGQPRGIEVAKKPSGPLIGTLGKVPGSSRPGAPGLSGTPGSQAAGSRRGRWAGRPRGGLRAHPGRPRGHRDRGPEPGGRHASAAKSLAPTRSGWSLCGLRIPSATRFDITF